MNKVIIKGRLTADPEMRTTSGGKNIVNFKVAVDRKYSKEKTADFFDCFAWEKTADIIFKNLNKGKEILVSGEMQCEKYQDKEDKTRYAWKIKVDEFDFCGSKDSNNSTAPAQNDSIPSYSEQGESSFQDLSADDEFPF